MELTAHVLVAGNAEGPALVLSEPLSLWGGVDPHTGVITDQHHPRAGAGTAGCVLVLPHGRGSSSSSSVLAECIRAQTGPVALVMEQADSILALGALVAAEMYPDRPCPVVVMPAACSVIRDGAHVTVSQTGRVRILAEP